MTDRAVLEGLAREIGHTIAIAIDDMPKSVDTKRGIGFALLLFDFGGKGNLAWISNAQRPDMIKALGEFIEKEGVA